MTLHRSGRWLAAGLLLMAMPTGDQAAAAPITGTCRPTAVRYSISNLDNTQRSLNTYGYIPEAAVNFTQGGSAASCVIVNFWAHAVADTDGLLAIRAIIDPGKTSFFVAYPQEVYFAYNDGINGIAHSAEFIFPRVAPGAHIIAMQFRSTGVQGSHVTVHRHTTTVHFVP